MAEEAHPAYLSPSELGTKDYWETYYARTLAHISNPTDQEQARDTAEKDNDNDDDNENDSDADADSVNDEDDPGTSWFSEHNAPEKVLRFLTRSSFPLSPRSTRGSTTQPSVLDLGTGNGSMLALLRKKGGFLGDLVGVDYSAQSVWLARELQRTRGHSAYHTDSEDEDDEDDEGEGEGEGEQDSAPATSAEPHEIQFEEWDILGSKAILSPLGKQIQPASTDETLSWFPYSRGGFDIVLDKGTFDAISLAGDAKETRVCERYPSTVRKLIRDGGFLIVTSCNWTEEELVQWFTAAEGSDRFVVWGRVEYPRFRFGGQEGQGVCTVCFQRVVS